MLETVLSLILSLLLTIIAYKIIYVNDEEYSTTEENPEQDANDTESNKPMVSSENHHSNAIVEFFNYNASGDEKTISKIHNYMIYIMFTRALFIFAFFIIICIVSSMTNNMSEACKAANPILFDTVATFAVLRWIIFAFSCLISIPMAIAFYKFVLSSSSSLLIRTCKDFVRNNCLNLIMRVQRREQPQEDTLTSNENL